LALLMTQIITNDTQIKNALVVCPAIIFFAWTWTSNPTVGHKCHSTLLCSLPLQTS
jgi:hypothetical protein